MITEIPAQICTRHVVAIRITRLGRRGGRLPPERNVRAQVAWWLASWAVTISHRRAADVSLSHSGVLTDTPQPTKITVQIVLSLLVGCGAFVFDLHISPLL